MSRIPENIECQYILLLTAAQLLWKQMPVVEVSEHIVNGKFLLSPPPSLSIGWQLVLFRGPDPQIPPTISYGVGSVIWAN